MNENIIKEYDGVHDNEIISYQVDLHNKTLQLFTKYQSAEKASILFTEVMAHRFEDVIYCNIINRISQLSIDYFINENRELLEESRKYAFPIYTDNIEALQSRLKEKELKIFQIDSTLGLCGFVIAKEILIEVSVT